MAVQSQARRRERIRAELRQAVFTLCTAGGVLLAMPWAFSYKAKPAPCATDGVHIAADCVSKGIGSTLIPMLERIALGCAVGMAVGLTLCLTVPGLKRRG